MRFADGGRKCSERGDSLAKKEIFRVRRRDLPRKGGAVGWLHTGTGTYSDLSGVLVRGGQKEVGGARVRQTNGENEKVTMAVTSGDLDRERRSARTM